MTDAPYPIDYPALARAVAALALTPAELHGGLCGFLCAGGQPHPGHWLDQLCLDSTALEASSRPTLEALRAATQTLLDDPDLRFSPLLPGDEVAMADRVVALAAWCAGFIGGFGLAGAVEAGRLSEEGRDALRDLDRIAHFGYEAGEAEEDENAFAEIVEYVRMAVMLLRQESGPAAAPADATRH
ncbi:MAG: UPF0149 family protein [Pseudoxanthomonas sp.]|nr:UPF0149 family protein [Pseudoxanthomonas sp.]